MKKFTTLILAILILSFNKSLPKETAFTQEDKEILIRIETSLKVFMEQTNKRFQELREDMNKRFQELREDTNKRFEIVDKRITELREDMNKRFEQVDKRITELREDMNKRFEQVDKRFEQVNERFNDLINFLWIITGIFTTIMVATLGFAWWDRRLKSYGLL